MMVLVREERVCTACDTSLCRLLALQVYTLLASVGGGLRYHSDGVDTVRSSALRPAPDLDDQ
jgi:hypothetical protein